jgi:hypothetical protein
MATYEVKRVVCSKCGKKLGWGFRRFGPREIRCGHCQTLLSTNFESDWMQPFPAWGDGDSWFNSNKLRLSLAELLVPSWLGVPGLMGFIFHMFVFAVFTGVVTIVALPVTLWASGLADPAHHGLWVRGFGFLVTLGVTLVTILAYPTLLVGRLYLLVREVNASYRTKMPPIWN